MDTQKGTTAINRVMDQDLDGLLVVWPPEIPDGSTNYVGGPYLLLLLCAHSLGSACPSRRLSLSLWRAFTPRCQIRLGARQTQKRLSHFSSEFLDNTKLRLLHLYSFGVLSNSKPHFTHRYDGDGVASSSMITLTFHVTRARSFTNRSPRNYTRGRHSQQPNSSSN